MTAEEKRALVEQRRAMVLERITAAGAEGVSTQQVAEWTGVERSCASHTYVRPHVLAGKVVLVHVGLHTRWMTLEGRKEHFDAEKRAKEAARAARRLAWRQRSSERMRALAAATAEQRRLAREAREAEEQHQRELKQAAREAERLAQLEARIDPPVVHRRISARACLPVKTNAPRSVFDWKGAA